MHTNLSPILTDSIAKLAAWEAAGRLLVEGWAVERASLYDEEAVDGWRWTDPNGREFGVIGDWNEAPPVPSKD